MKILIITGGNSPERKISLMSAKAVKEALEKNKFKVQFFDLKKGVGELGKIAPKFDLIFPVIHGEEGESGWLQKFLSTLGKPFIGGNYLGYQEGWYKISFKQFCKKNGILTPAWQEVKTENDIIKFGFPCVLKSSNGGSSKEVLILSTIKDLKSRKYKNLLNSQLSLLVEKYISGVEVTASILGNQALPLMEIKPPKGEWFNFKNKYSGKAQEIPHAPSLPKEIYKLVQEVTLKIHKTLDLGPFSRTDFIVSNSSSHLKSGKLIPHVLEVNTIPGLTPNSLFPKAAKAAGLSFEKLIKKIVETSL